MNWINGIQRAIDYIEAHLTGDIDYALVAREACSTEYHFQRMFSAITGYTVGDYVRMRRLSMSAYDLVEKGDKVIDVAVKYGYDNPESFTRAFTRFHGVSPTEAKNGAIVRTFFRLSVKLSFTGGRTMDYRIEKLDEFKAVCKVKKVEKPANMTATADIYAYWDECIADGSMQRILGYFPEKGRLGGLLGICFSSEMDDGHFFPYGIGVESDGREVTDEDLQVVTIPAHTYAVFPVRGSLPDAFVHTYRKIVTEFFPQNDRYEYGNGTELEVYPSDNTDGPDFYCEIWIAVNTKS